MVKWYYGVFLGLLGCHLFSVHGEVREHSIDFIRATPWYRKAAQEVLHLRSSYQALAKGAAIGAGVGVLGTGAFYVAVGTGVDILYNDRLTEGTVKEMRELIPVVAAGAGALGGVVGAGFEEGKRRYFVWRIDKAFERYTRSRFMDLSMDEAVMVLLVFHEKIYEMRLLATHLKDFLDKKGVLYALAHLYFNKTQTFGTPPTPQMVEEFKDIVWTK